MSSSLGPDAAKHHLRGERSPPSPSLEFDDCSLSNSSRANATTASLLTRICNRDDGALRELYELHGGLLFAIGLRLLRDRSDAEQLLIDVFMEIWLHADRYDLNRGGPLQYLILLTRSRGLDRLRSRRKVSQPLTPNQIEQSDETPSPLEVVVSDEHNSLIKRALADLPGNERVAVELSFLDGLSHTEIAERLRRPLGTVKTDVMQGLIHLRAILRAKMRGD